MIKFSDAAHVNVLETGLDPEVDISSILSGELTRETLLAHCLDGANEDRRQGWKEYVATICEEAERRISETDPLCIKRTHSYRMEHEPRAFAEEYRYTVRAQRSRAGFMAYDRDDCAIRPEAFATEDEAWREAARHRFYGGRPAPGREND